MILGHWWVIVAFVLIVLIFYGPGRMSEIGGALGKGLNEFRKASSRVLDDGHSADSRQKSEPPPPAAQEPKS